MNHLTAAAALIAASLPVTVSAHAASAPMAAAPLSAYRAVLGGVRQHAAFAPGVVFTVPYGGTVETHAAHVADDGIEFDGRLAFWGDGYAAPQGTFLRRYRAPRVKGAPELFCVDPDDPKVPEPLRCLARPAKGQALTHTVLARPDGSAPVWTPLAQPLSAYRAIQPAMRGSVDEAAVHTWRIRVQEPDLTPDGGLTKVGVRAYLEKTLGRTECASRSWTWDKKLDPVRPGSCPAWAVTGQTQAFAKDYTRATGNGRVTGPLFRLTADHTNRRVVLYLQRHDALIGPDPDHEALESPFGRVEFPLVHSAPSGD